MEIKLINIGFGNIVSANRIVAIVSPESAPIKRIIQEARDRGMLIDATYGRRTRAVIITDSDHVILSSVQPETVAHRLSSKENSGVFEGVEYVIKQVDPLRDGGGWVKLKCLERGVSGQDQNSVGQPIGE